MTTSSHPDASPAGDASKPASALGKAPRAPFPAQPDQPVPGANAPVPASASVWPPVPGQAGAPDTKPAPAPARAGAAAAVVKPPASPVRRKKKTAAKPAPRKVKKAPARSAVVARPKSVAKTPAKPSSGQTRRKAKAKAPAGSAAKAPAKHANKAVGKTPAKVASKRPAKAESVAKSKHANAGRSAGHSAEIKPGKKAKPKKAKLIRDSFTMPESEYALFATLKKRCMAKGLAVKKSELLRAAIIGFAALSDRAVTTALRGVEVLKTGRPPKAPR